MTQDILERMRELTDPELALEHKQRMDETVKYALDHLEEWRKAKKNTDFERARSYYSELVQKFPDSPLREHNHLILGFAHMEHGDAIAMYRAAGFLPVGRRRNYYRGSDGRRFDALTFAKDFSDRR